MMSGDLVQSMQLSLVHMLHIDDGWSGHQLLTHRWKP